MEKLENVNINIMFIKTDPNESDTVSMQIASITEITNLYVASGDHILVAMVITRDRLHYEQIRQEITTISGIVSLIY